MYKEQEIFIQNLKFYRKKKSMSQQQLAELCDVSNGTIGNIESGITKPSFDLIINIANKLQVAPYRFFIEKDFEEEIFSEIQFNLLENKMNNMLKPSISSALDKVIKNFIQEMQSTSLSCKDGRLSC